METGKSTAYDKHVVLVVPGFPRDEQDTQCLPVVHIYAQALAAQVRKVSVIALHYPYRDTAYVWRGMEVHPLNGANKRWKRTLTLYRNFRRRVQELHREDPVSVLHAFWINDPGAFALRAGKALQIPALCSSPGQDVQAGNRYLLEIRKHAKAVYCMSQFQTPFLQKAGFGQVQVIEWGTQASTVRSARNFDFCCVSSLIPLKNVEYVVRLVAALHAQNVPIRGKIVGGGPQQSMLASLIHSLGVGDAIELLGERSHEETLELIAQAKILVHASHFEGFGMVHIEALAAGCHVLSTPVGVAWNNPRIHTLHVKLEEDVATLRALLQAELPEPFLYSIEDTVRRYLAVYEAF